MTADAAHQSLVPAGADPFEALARDYAAARGLGIEVLMMVGGGGESLLRHLPERARDRLGLVVAKTLTASLRAARLTRRLTGRCPTVIERALPALTGAVSGLAGAAGAVADTPVVVTLILRSVLNEAQAAGFDPEEEATQVEALRVLASAGPLDDDDGTDFALVITKATVTGASLATLIHGAAGRLAISMSQKVAAQAVPVLGAAAGATINTVFSNYYREMARIHFRALAPALRVGLFEHRLLCQA